MEEDLFGSLTYDFLSSSPEQLFLSTEPDNSSLFFSQYSDVVEFTEEAIELCAQNPRWGLLLL